MNTQAKPYQLIEREDQVQSAISILDHASALSFDLEFDREQNTYGFTLCLLQIATPQQCILVDPMLEHNVLDPFLRLLEKAGIPKLVHSSSEDLRLMHASGCVPTMVVDTEVYARWLNIENMSLATLLQQWCGVTLTKDMQRSNWTLRPLKPQQLQYASQDVVHLFALHQALHKEAMARNLLDLIAEDLSVLNEQRFDDEGPYPFLKAGDEQRYSPFDLHVLHGMMALRAELARKINKPMFYITPDKLMREAVIDEENLDLLFDHHAVHRLVKQQSVQEKWRDHYDALIAEATKLGLPKKMVRKGPYISSTEMKRQEEMVFKPIQQLLEQRWGLVAARYILSNRLAQGLIKKETSIAQWNHPLKQRLIQEAAKDVGVDIGPWLG